MFQGPCQVLFLGFLIESLSLCKIDIVILCYRKRNKLMEPQFLEQLSPQITKSGAAHFFTSPHSKNWLQGSTRELSQKPNP